MALFKCPECGRVISDKADACPSCGYVLKSNTTSNNNDNNNNRSHTIIILALIALIAALAVVGILLYKANNSETSIPTETTTEQKDTVVADNSVAETDSRYSHLDKSTKDDNKSLKNRRVFTLVYTTSDDGFLNIRSKPSMDGVKLEELHEICYGLGDGMLIQNGAKWSKVRKGDVEGWVSNKFLGRQTWYTGKGGSVLVAKQLKTTIYIDNFGDGPAYSPFEKVPKGTIIADKYTPVDGYYMLVTAHDNLYVKKSDVEILTQ